MSHFGDQKRKYIVCGLLSITCVFKALFLHHVPLERSTDDEASRQDYIVAKSPAACIRRAYNIVYDLRCYSHSPRMPVLVSQLQRGSRDTLDGWLAGW